MMNVSKRKQMAQRNVLLNEKSNCRTMKKCLENNKTILRSQQSIRIEMLNIFTKKINKMPLVQMMIRKWSHLKSIWLRPWKNMQNRIEGHPKIKKLKKLHIMTNFKKKIHKNTIYTGWKFLTIHT